MARRLHFEVLRKLFSCRSTTSSLAARNHEVPAYEPALFALAATFSRSWHQLAREVSQYGARCRQSSTTAHRAVLPEEIEKFKAMAETWWDEEGSQAMLHRMNPVRVAFIRDAAAAVFGEPREAARPLEGLSILDVGCGGGLLTEALARLGANVTGVDAGPQVIQVAQQHAAQDPAVQERTQYIVGTAEELAASGRQYQVVVASEVIEHVPDPKGFCRALTQLAASPGAVVVSTLNRTPRAYALAIGAAEYLLGWVPRSTHDWNKFVTPEELVMMMAGSKGAELGGLSGMVYNPFSRRWSMSVDTAVNYIAFFRKTGTDSVGALFRVHPWSLSRK